MFHTIVVGTDGSPGGNRAIDRAAEQAVAAAAAADTQEATVSLHLVSAFSPLIGWEMSGYATEPAAPSNLIVEQNAMDLLDEAELRLLPLGLVDRGVTIEKHPMIGAPFDALTELAAKLDADLIVVGTRGLGLGRRLLVGSVSTKVVHHARCNVLVVHDEDETPADDAPKDGSTAH